MGLRLPGGTTPRQVAVAVGCVLVLTLGIGSVSVLNGMSSMLVEGMGADLVSYSLGPSVKSACGFVLSFAAARAMARVSSRKCLLVGTFAMTAAMLLYAAADNVGVWYAGSVVNGAVLAFGSNAAVTGVLNEHFGPRAPVVLGYCYGTMSLLLSGIVFCESFALRFVGYRDVLVGYAAIVLAVGLAANLLLIGRAPGRFAAAGAPAADGTQASSAAHAGPRGLSGVARRPVFYLFCLTMLLAALPLNGFSAFCQNYLVARGMAPQDATAVFSVFVFASAVVSFFSGKASKLLGTSRLAWAMFGGFAAGTALLLAAGGSAVGAAAALAVCALVGPSSILPGLLIPHFFGTSSYASVSAVGMGFYYLGASVSYYVAASVMQAAGFSVGFGVLAGAGLLVAVLVTVCGRAVGGK